MNNKSNKNPLIPIPVILALLYTVVVMTAFVHKTSVFWFSYGFTMLAAMTLIFSLSAATLKDNVMLKDMFLGLPLIIITCYYAVIQAALSIVMMINPSFPMSWVLVIQIILLCIYGVLAVSALAGKKTLITIDEKQAGIIYNARELQTDVQSIISEVNDVVSKHKLEALYEILRFSDPVCPQALSSLNKQIDMHINGLKALIGDKEMICAECDAIITLLQDRNERCKLNKQ